MRMKLALAAALLLASGSAAFAVTDEIQVYTGEVVAPGEIGLTWHNSYSVNGFKTPDYPGAVLDDGSYSSVIEWALGVNDWFEAGLYLPLYSNSSNLGWSFNGFKLRALFVQPHNEEKNFYYGVNFEFSWNEKSWDTQVNTGEIRPIIGYRWDNGVSFTLNPIIDNTYKGGIGGLEFVPAARLDYAINPTWTIAAETYSDFGQLRGFLPQDQQSHSLWAVVDYSGLPISVETGVGFGLSKGATDLAVKLMFISDLTGPHRLFQ